MEKEKMGEMMKEQSEKMGNNISSQEKTNLQSDMTQQRDILEQVDMLAQNVMSQQVGMPLQNDVPQQNGMLSQNNMSQQNGTPSQNVMPQQNGIPSQNNMPPQNGMPMSNNMPPQMNMPFQNGMPPQNNILLYNSNKPKEVPKMVKTMQRDYWQYIGIAAIFAVMFVFCLYKNVAGITAPLFTIGTLGVLYLFAKKNDIEIKKSAIPLAVAFVAFGISCFLTNNGVMIFYNYIAGIFLVSLLVLMHLHDTENWNLSDYISQLFFVCFIGIAENMLECFPMYKVYKKEYAAKEEGKSFKNSKAMPILLGALCAIPMVFFVGSLLMSSDAVFGDLSIGFLESFFEINVWIDNIFGVCFWLVIAFLGFYALLMCFAKNKNKEYQVNHIEKRDPFLAIGFLTPLLILYAIFSWVQIGALFLGSMHLPEGYNYSEYAREGFWQLLFVCIVNLGIVLICYSCFKESKALKIVQTLMIVCTYIMLLSAAFRMGMYVDAYGLTRKRVYVFWALVVLAILFIGVAMAVWKGKFSLFRFGTTVVVVMYLCFSLSHVDYWIAHYNLFVRNDLVEMEDDWGSTTVLEYLQEDLSLDAAPVVFDYYENVEKDDIDSMYQSRINIAYECMGGRSFNLSKWIAGNGLHKICD